MHQGLSLLWVFANVSLSSPMEHGEEIQKKPHPHVYLDFSSKRPPLLSLAEGGPLPSLSITCTAYCLHSTFYTRKYVNLFYLFIIHMPTPPHKYFLSVLHLQFIQVAEHLEIMLFFWRTPWLPNFIFNPITYTREKKDYTVVWVHVKSLKEILHTSIEKNKSF